MTAVTASFVSNLPAAPVNAASVTLLSPGGAAIPAGLTATGSQLHLTPLTALPGDTTYTVRLAAGFADASGRKLSVPATVSFTTAAQAWSDAPSVVETLPKDSAIVYPTAAVDRSGNVIAIWQTTTGSSLYAARFEIATGKWSAPMMVVPATDKLLFARTLVANSTGEVFLYWIEQALGAVGAPPPVPNQLRQSRFDSATSTWTAPVTLTLLPAGLVVETLRVVPDRSGGLIALMSNSAQYTPSGIYAARLSDPAGSWSTAERIDRPGTSGRQPYSFSAAADQAGNVIAVWVDVANDVRNLMSARYDAATKLWSAPDVIAENVGDGGSSGMLAMDPAGAAVTIWTDRAPAMGLATAVRVARFDPVARTWSSGRRIDTAFHPTAYPQIVLDAAGHVSAIWIQQPYLLEVVSARFDPATLQWSAPKTLSTGGAVELGQPKMATDVAGNVIVTFIEGKSMSAVRYRSSDKSWGAVTHIGKHAEGTEKSTLDPSLVMDASGVATVVWPMTNQLSWGIGARFDNEVVANRFR